MKTLITVLSTATALTAAIALSGFDFDAAVVVSICFASGLAALFVKDYSRTPRYNLEAEKAPAHPARHARHSEAGLEFATFATFNTTIG